MSAIACRVRSSAVGPRPPDAITRSARSQAWRKTRTFAARSSATVLWNITVTPSSPSRSLSHWLLVSSRWPLVSSSPMEMTSACILTAVRAVSSYTPGKGNAAGSHQEDDPSQLEQQAADELGALDFAQKHGGRKVGQVFERQHV